MSQTKKQNHPVSTFLNEARLPGQASERLTAVRYDFEKKRDIDRVIASPGDLGLFWLQDFAGFFFFFNVVVFFVYVLLNVFFGVFEGWAPI